MYTFRRNSLSLSDIKALSVLPDERRYLQTKQKKKTCNPVFDEHFGFTNLRISNIEKLSPENPLRCVSERSLRVSVFDGGRHKRQAAIGHVIYPLAQVPADSAAAVAASNGSTTNNIIVRDLSRQCYPLCYFPCNMQRQYSILSPHANTPLLSRNIPYSFNRFFILSYAVNDGEVVSWVKVSLMNQRRAVKTKKTTVVAACEEPQYNESFHFRPRPPSRGSTSPSSCMWRRAPTLRPLLTAPNIPTGRLVGRVIIGSFMFARGRALNHWNEVLSTPKEPIQFWHSLTE
ncbi:synaptotagmin-15-like [Penaeus indicus]|uniref:synaptotagmin-15-like n=1 Tax=Penaeus indicus TaxID=29960 RepID=UPI00300CBA1B